MSMEHDFNQALYDMDCHVKEATTAQMPDNVKHAWVKIHGLVHHQRNTVAFSEKRRAEMEGEIQHLKDQLKVASAEIATRTDQFTHLQELFQALQFQHGNLRDEHFPEEADARGGQPYAFEPELTPEGHVALGLAPKPKELRD